MACELCSKSGEILWKDSACRVILVNDADHPAFCRVIWNAHVKEMGDLDKPDRMHLFNVVLAVETALREVLDPDKINLASLGNVTPHLHWHVIPRYCDDPHFPNPVWGQKLRAAPHALPRDFRAKLQNSLQIALNAH